MNPVDLALEFAGSRVVGMPVWILWTAIVTALVLVVVELGCFLRLAARAAGSRR